MKLLVLPLIFFGLIACTEAPPVQEFFCEAYAQEGQSRNYKQHIVQLSKASFCLLGLAELPVCASHNQNTTTSWRSKDGKTQERESVQVKLNKDLVIMDIDLENRPAKSEQTSSETTHAALHYEFQTKLGMLTLTSDESTEPTEFACKPWAKRAWWQVY